MAQPIERPSYFEGQILAARDLTGAVDYARGRAQRHDRLLHRWGIASGLEIVSEESRTEQNVPFVALTVNPGVAIDGAGREVVLGEARRLQPQDFERSNVKVEDGAAWYPVFLRRTVAAAASTALSGPCAGSSAQPTRFVEGSTLVFGGPGAAADLEAQPRPEPGDEIASDEPWNVLLGFVQWNGEAENFSATKAEVDGVSRRSVGVRAEVVESPGDSLTLLTRPPGEPGAPLARIDQNELSFGLSDGSGGLTKVFTVNRKGEVTAAGKPLGGGVRVESGLVSNGMRVPLPANVTEDAVRERKVSLHISVTPLLSERPSATADFWTPEAYVDEDRRVHCRMRVLALPASVTIEPAICSYTIVAFTDGTAK
jgi:hypothetical protein